MRNEVDIEQITRKIYLVKIIFIEIPSQSIRTYALYLRIEFGHKFIGGFEVSSFGEHQPFRQSFLEESQ